MAGTVVDTDRGPRPIEAVREGMRVRDADGQLQVVRRMMKRSYAADVTEVFPDGLVFAPRDALGNCDDLFILPNQPLRFEGSLVMADALAGHGAVFRAIPVDGITFLRPIFERAATLKAAGALEFVCPDGNGGVGGIRVGPHGGAALVRRLAGPRAQPFPMPAA
ncbi:MAG: Hint domain-containing protein [Pseudomonadota bacterium]